MQLLDHQATETVSVSTLMQRSGRIAISILLVLMLLAVGLYRLDAGELSWDEGWTLSVARTWVEHGYYARLREGQPAPRGLDAAFTVTAPVALSFRLFGVGIWQGRLPGVLFTIGALVLMVILTRMLYTSRIAYATIAVLLLLSIHPQTNALLLGRQVLGEMPMFFYLLAGYVLFLLALQRSIVFLPLAVLVWGAALLTKAQLPPFWTLALVVPLCVACLNRKWRLAVMFAVAIIGARLTSQWLYQLQLLILEDRILLPAPVSGLYEVLAWVPRAFNRIFALQMALICGIPTAVGLCYEAARWLRKRSRLGTQAEQELIRLSLLMFAGSWFTWFLLLSVGVPRYLFPAMFVGSIFVAKLLDTLTCGFDPTGTFRRSARPLTRNGAGALFALLLLAMTLPLTLLTLIRSYTAPPDIAPLQTAAYFNDHTMPDTLIETYESELHFLLNRPYHYPPDQIHIELNRRGLLGQDVPIDYDPLLADPDYLVVGRFAAGNGLYDEVLKTGSFRLIETFGRYQIYERVR
ncbi:MAG: glycosyl transferase [Herpetosiphonaceae bacterium]|nr:MAG: glycosyl transferase [Herpetosiphonaceae bacterium]